MMELGKRIRELRNRDGRTQEVLAEELGVEFADAADWGVELSYDGVHFTENGHAAFAAGLERVLES